MEDANSGGGGKTALIVVIVVILVAVAGLSVWYFFMKKSPEGGVCKSAAQCEDGFKCLNKICSSGKTGSSCDQKSDCQSKICAKNICTEGKIGDACTTYGDCGSGLLCKKSACATKPDYSKYFSSVTISKMKPGLPPGPGNPLTVTDKFIVSDAIEIDFGGVKTTTVGAYYIEFVNSTTGEVVRTTQGTMETSFAGRDTGMGTDLGGMTAGSYDVNVYYNNEIVYSVSITVS